MQLVRSQSQATTCLGGDPGEQRRGIVGVEPVERTVQTFVIELGSGDPRPSRCSTGFVLKNWDTKYILRLAKPNPLRIMATVAVLTPTRSGVCSSRASRYSASPISRHKPATIPR